MKTIILFLFTIISFYGCAATPNEYRWKIENWQTKMQNIPIKHKTINWTDKQINNAIKGALALSKYESDPIDDDNWDGYQSFDLKGDCEDIATFMYAVLKGLGYQNDIRMRIVRMPLGDHAVLMVKMPNNKWKMFNSVPSTNFDLAFSRTIVEWDDKYIYYQ